MGKEGTRAESKLRVLRHPLALVAGVVLAVGAGGLLYDTLSDDPQGEAADLPGSIYWTNGAGSVAHANLDGSGGGDVNTAGATIGTPAGTALDLAGDRVWWANSTGPISHAGLGGGGTDFSVTGTTVNQPVGLVIDSARERIYWANYGDNRISFADLDGSGGGDVNTTGATTNGVHGLTVNPARTKVYWANHFAGISWASLDGSGGGDIDTTGATVSNTNGVALDPEAGRIYWANRGAGISYANADGSGGGGDLDTTGATVNGPYGVAIDSASRRIYWANLSGGTISYADLGGGGGGDLGTTGATVSQPNFPVLLKPPSGSGASIEGSRVVGAPLSCTVTWADPFWAMTYSSPVSVAFAWSRDGSGVPGATSTSFTPDSPGGYACSATGSNQAGSGTQLAGPVTVSVALTLGKPKPNKSKGTTVLPASPKAAGSLRLSGKGVVAQVRQIGSAQTVNLTVKPKGALKRKLASKGKASVKVTVSFTPTGGSPTTLAKKLKLAKRLS